MSHQYEHDEYTHPDVFTVGVDEGWAEAETDPALIDWAERQARAAIPFHVTPDGRPVNPCARTSVRRGRNLMGFWGEQQTAHVLATADRGGRRLLMIERWDGGGWAVPGGHRNPGGTVLDAALRELREQTCLGDVSPFPVRELAARYVPDPGSSGEAWAVTFPVHVDLGYFGDTGLLPFVAGRSGALRAEWVPAETYDDLALYLMSSYGGRVFAAHAGMLEDFLGVEW
jgi:ADP-ribose pyrophosphatase